MKRDNDYVSNDQHAGGAIRIVNTCGTGGSQNSEILNWLCVAGAGGCYRC